MNHAYGWLPDEVPAFVVDACTAGPERVNSSAIELSLTPARRKNAGTFGMPTSIV